MHLHHRMASLAFIAAVGLSAASCEDSPPVSIDMAAPDLAPLVWNKGLLPTSMLFPTRRGLKVARGAIHIHSPFSHDACDGKPQVNGQPDPTCLEHLRAALCTTHYDYAMMTDHGDFVAETNWDDLFLSAIGTQPIVENGKHIASKLTCPDGHTTLITVGSENDLMPIALEEPVAATADERGVILRGTDGAAAAAFRSHGALVAVAHGEAHTDAQLADVDPDALEIYNLHANLAPNIREAMGLDPNAAVAALLPLIQNADPTLVPDMALLAFWEENAIELDRLEVRWSAGARVLATLGVDAHENAIPALMSDGERGDSYRRELRWFSNHLLVDELSPRGLKDAIGKARGYAAFEIFGEPVGLDFRAESGATIAEIGDEVTIGSDLVLEPPTRPEIAGQDVQLRILRVDSGTSTEVASGPGTQLLRVKTDRAAAYRAEVRITPKHLAPFTGPLTDKLMHPYVWVYTSPIYVR